MVSVWIPMTVCLEIASPAGIVEVDVTRRWAGVNISTVSLALPVIVLVDTDAPAETVAVKVMCGRAGVYMTTVSARLPVIVLVDKATPAETTVVDVTSMCAGPEIGAAPGGGEAPGRANDELPDGTPSADPPALERPGEASNENALGGLGKGGGINEVAETRTCGVAGEDDPRKTFSGDGEGSKLGGLEILAVKPGRNAEAVDKTRDEETPRGLRVVRAATVELAEADLAPFDPEGSKFGLAVGISTRTVTTVSEAAGIKVIVCMAVPLIPIVEVIKGN